MNEHFIEKHQDSCIFTMHWKYCISIFIKCFISIFCYFLYTETEINQIQDVFLNKCFKGKRINSSSFALYTVSRNYGLSIVMTSRLVRHTFGIGTVWICREKSSPGPPPAYWEKINRNRSASLRDFELCSRLWPVQTLYWMPTIKPLFNWKAKIL